MYFIEHSLLNTDFLLDFIKSTVLYIYKFISSKHQLEIKF